MLHLVSVSELTGQHHHSGEALERVSREPAMVGATSTGTAQVPTYVLRRAGRTKTRSVAAAALNGSDPWRSRRRLTALLGRSTPAPRAGGFSSTTPAEFVRDHALGSGASMPGDARKARAENDRVVRLGPPSRTDAPSTERRGIWKRKTAASGGAGGGLERMGVLARLVVLVLAVASVFFPRPATAVAFVGRRAGGGSSTTRGAASVDIGARRYAATAAEEATMYDMKNLPVAIGDVGSMGMLAPGYSSYGIPYHGKNPAMGLFMASAGVLVRMLINVVVICAIHKYWMDNK